MTYTVTLTPTTSGEVIISVPENVATDGVGNPNTASTTYTVMVNLDALTVGYFGAQMVKQTADL